MNQVEGKKQRPTLVDHENHYRMCQGHNDTTDQSPGEEKHELATTQLPSGI